MGYRCGFLILAEKENRTTKAIEEVFRKEAENDAESARSWDDDAVAIKENTDSNGVEYKYYRGQGYYLTDYSANDWWRKPNGVLGAKKNQKYKVLFESCHSGTGFNVIKGDRSGCWKTREGDWLSYYDQPLYYAIVDRLKRFKNVEAKLFTFEVNDGMRRTKPKFIEDWPGEIL